MKRNILVIDDDKSVHELAQLFLGQSGFAVNMVSDGNAALDELARHNYDLLLLDINMPGMNGLEVLKNIRAQERLKQVPIVMFTASRDVSHLMTSKRMGISDYVVKPPQRQDLLSRVERILGGEPQQEEELVFDPSWSLAQGTLEVPIRIKSLSHRGVIVYSPIPLEKASVLKNLNLNVFNAIGVKQLEYDLIECVKGKKVYEYMLYFRNIDRTSQNKIRDWVLNKVFEAKARARLSSGRASEKR